MNFKCKDGFITLSETTIDQIGGVLKDMTISTTDDDNSLDTVDVPYVTHSTLNILRNPSQFWEELRYLGVDETMLGLENLNETKFKHFVYFDNDYKTHVIRTNIKNDLSSHHILMPEAFEKIPNTELLKVFFKVEEHGAYGRISRGFASGICDKVYFDTGAEERTVLLYTLEDIQASGWNCTAQLDDLEKYLK